MSETGAVYKFMHSIKMRMQTAKSLNHKQAYRYLSDLLEGIKRMYPECNEEIYRGDYEWKGANDEQ